MQLSALCRGGVTVRCEQRMRPPTQAVLFRRENGLSHGLNKVKGTSQPGRLAAPRVPLLRRTKDTPVPTATPTLAELATRPCQRPVSALANLVWLDRVLAATLYTPLG